MIAEEAESQLNRRVRTTYLRYTIPAARVAPDPGSLHKSAARGHKAARKGLSVVEAYVGERYAHGARNWIKLTSAAIPVYPT
ncbi:unnamed protein product [Echinostoma caproni]|uniref:Integrase n=1 Tax=Echinostoma caproni TaxID=27848 RepID=A0A183BCJ0_9TREM|nr:unnamed protein product [Echinostoma caproni]